MTTEEGKNISEKNATSILSKISIGIRIVCVLFFPIFSISTAIAKSSGYCWIWFVASLFVAITVLFWALEIKSDFFIASALIIAYIGISLSGFIVTPGAKIAIIKHEENIVTTKIPRLTWPYGKTITYEQGTFVVEKSLIVREKGIVITGKIEFEVDRAEIKQIFEEFDSYEIWTEEAEKIAYETIDDVSIKFVNMSIDQLTEIKTVELQLTTESISKFEELHMIFRNLRIIFGHKKNDISTRHKLSRFFLLK
jgi:hypothetical protein